MTLNQNYISAIDNIEKAIAVINEIELDDPLILSQLHEQQAVNYSNLDSVSISEYYINKAIQTLNQLILKQQDSPKSEGKSIAHVDKLYKLYETKAKILYNNFKLTKLPPYLNKSLNTYKKIDSLRNQINNNRWSKEMNEFIASYYKEDAKELLDLIYESQSIESNKDLNELAFEFMEKSRYSSIYRNQVNSSLSSNVSIIDSIRIVDNNFKSKIERTNNKILQTENKISKTNLQNELFKLHQEYELFQDNLSARYPAYSIINYNEMLSIKDIQNNLNQKTVLLEYFWSADYIYILQIESSTSTLHKVELTQQLYEDIQWIRKRLTGFNKTDRSLEQYSSISYSVYKKVVEPFITKNLDRVIFSLDGPLSSIPFEAFITKEVNSNWKTAPYLLHNITVQHALSSNILFLLRKKENTSNPSALGLSFSDENERIKSNIDASSTNPNNHFDEIFWSSKEIDYLQSKLKSNKNKFAKSQNATETFFKQNADDAQIVHLAVHGIASNEQNVESYLKFKSQQDSLNDGYLYSHELYNLNLPKTRLTVLTSCDSGIGKEIVGEGIYSIGRGFIYAGSPSVVISLWNISDRQSSKISQYFYEEVFKGGDIASSLRKAKIKYLNKTKNDKEADPIHWAGLIQIGDSTPIVNYEKNSSLIIYTLLALLLSGLIIKLIWRV